VIVSAAGAQRIFVARRVRLRVLTYVLCPSGSQTAIPFIENVAHFMTFADDFLNA
jgi:hypothetical protein